MSKSSTAPVLRPGQRKRPLKTLDRMLSKAGPVAHRRSKLDWSGPGSVNGKVIQSPDHWVDLERDSVTLDNNPLLRPQRRYILLYKPKGYLTTYPRS